MTRLVSVLFMLSVPVVWAEDEGYIGVWGSDNAVTVEMASMGGNGNVVTSEDDSEDGLKEIEQELERLCNDTPDLQYLHFNANHGSTSIKDCSWVGEKPFNRCELEVDGGFGKEKKEVSSKKTPLLLRDVCPLSCGLCPTDPLDQQDPHLDFTDSQLDSDDLTMEQIKKIEERRRRRKRNRKKKKKNRKPCPCPEEEDNSDAPTSIPVTDSPTGSPISTPSPTRTVTDAPTPAITLTSTQTSTSTFTSTSTSTSTSTITSSNSFSSSNRLSIIGGSLGDPIVAAVVSGQESGVNKKKYNRTLVIVLATAPLLLLLLLIFCCIRHRLKQSHKDYLEENNSDESDEEDEDFLIHKVKSVDSLGSRLLRVLGYFNGRENDARTDVHQCNSAVCEVCSPRIQQPVMSIDSYTDMYSGPRGQRGERYKVREEERFRDEEQHVEEEEEC